MTLPMGMTTATTSPRAPALERRVAMRLAATEYGRVVELLRTLAPADWSAPTECPGWDVRAIAGHLLGMAEMAASIREGRRQQKVAGARGGLFIDALTALQVEEHAGLSTGELLARFASVGPKAARARRRTPGLVRRHTMPLPQQVDGIEEMWTLGYLVDVILTRDPWMHRSDITRATGAELVLTADHDGAIVDDVVREWAQRHGQRCTVRLSGPAGGVWAFGAAGPVIEHDAVEFCRIISGRRAAEGLLCTQVPF